MRPSLRTTFILALAAAVPAAAQVGPPPGGGCEESPDGCGDPTPPTRPTIAGTGSVDGFYKVFPDADADLRYGYVQGGLTGYGGGGPFHPIGGDGTVTDGFSGSNVSLRATTPPADASSATTPPADASSATSAAADVDYSASASLFTGYLVELHAHSAAAYAALAPLLSTSGAIAGIHGRYSLAASGQAFGIVSAVTGGGDGVGDFTLDASLQRGFGSTCDYSGYYDTSGVGCGTAKTYDLDLNFAAGSTFTNGDPLSIYGTILLGSQVHAGGFQYDTPAGTASAFIDPTITLNPLFNSPLYALNIGNAVQPYTPGAVPEPAAWALLLAGFGAVGGMGRRTRLRTVAA